MGFPRQGCWSGLPLPPPGNLPNGGVEPVSPASSALAGRLFTTEPPGNPIVVEVLTFNSACLILNILWNSPHLEAIHLVLLSAWYLFFFFPPPFIFVLVGG